ncbi:hypothetical protein Sste5346_007595 [Sporothrix stenoceras]|uniref:Extracellular membrane protein CFEM domain-containing protein n=1 Tax=Sporothrix stenoceras TaxID=5173 RepID=A0ABR3YT45_9PEZI
MPSLSRGTTTGALLSIYLSFFLARPSFASTIGLPSEIVVFVPSCATACLSTFIDTNYPQGVCGTDPTFACLCAHTGSNGFTVGEGALACIASLDRTGQCTGTDVAATASQKAYSMCVGQSSAAAETHATIVATQVIPFQSQSTKTVTTTAAGNGAGDTNGSTDGSHTTEHTTARVTTSSSTSTSPHTSTTSTTSTRSPTYLTESTLITAPPRSSTTIAALPQTTSTSTSTKSASDTSSAQTGASPNQTQTQPNNKGVTSLSVGQIVGISVGTAAALFLAIAISLYLRVVRRRRLMLVPRLTGDSKQGQSHDSDEEGFRKRFRPRTGHELQISVPMNLQAPARARTSNKHTSRDSSRASTKI